MNNATHILLVEDDRHIAMALQIRLQAAGYLVMLATTIADAVSAANKQMPDVAVCDVNLPDGNGIDLMQTLCELEGGACMRLLVMSASRKPGLREYALSKGALAFLEKPFPSSELLDAIAG